MLVVWSPKSHALFWQILVSDIYKHVHAIAAATSLRNKNHPQQIWAATIFKTSNCDHKHHSTSTSVSTVIKVMKVSHFHFDSEPVGSRC